MIETAMNAHTRTVNMITAFDTKWVVPNWQNLYMYIYLYIVDWIERQFILHNYAEHIKRCPFRFFLNKREKADQEAAAQMGILYVLHLVAPSSTIFAK